MKRKQIYLAVAPVTFMLMSIFYTAKSIRVAGPNPPYYHKDYLDKPVLFAEGVISTGANSGCPSQKATSSLTMPALCSSDSSSARTSPQIA